MRHVPTAHRCYAIPIPSHAGIVDGWQSVPLHDNGDSLVAIGHGTDHDDVMTSAVYAGEHLHSPYRGDNVIDTADAILYVRHSVADRLRTAQSLLPAGMKLIVFDGYRSVEVQRALFDQFLDELRRLKPDWSEEQLIEETEYYVALPSTDASCPSPHSTGGAVDVAIISDNHMIEFGTPFDHGSERSSLRYFEDEVHVQDEADEQASEHRRLLYHIMHEAGFEGYEHEWWHYNAVETQMGACVAHRDKATYGIATGLLPENTFHHLRKVLLTHEEPTAPIDRIAPTN